MESEGHGYRGGPKPGKEEKLFKYHLGGFRFTDAVPPDVRRVLEKAVPFSAPGTPLYIVVRNNVIALFRILNFYSAFADIPDFEGLVAEDLHWPSLTTSSAIKRLARGRELFRESGVIFTRGPPAGSNASEVACDLADQWSQAMPEARPMTAEREAQLARLRRAWRETFHDDPKSLLAKAPSLFRQQPRPRRPAAATTATTEARSPGPALKSADSDYSLRRDSWSYRDYYRQRDDLQEGLQSLAFQRDRSASPPAPRYPREYDYNETALERDRLAIPRAPASGEDAPPAETLPGPDATSRAASHSHDSAGQDDTGQLAQALRGGELKVEEPEQRLPLQVPSLEEETLKKMNAFVKGLQEDACKHIGVLKELMANKAAMPDDKRGFMELIKAQLYATWYTTVEMDKLKRRPDNSSRG